MSTSQHNETVRAIDGLRSRIQSLITSLGKLIHDITTSDPLPPYTSLANSWGLIQHNLLSIHQILLSEKYAPLLKAAHLHPAPSYPGRTQEDLLTQLVRKKQQPAVEDWISDGRALFAKMRVADGDAETPTQGEGKEIVRRLGLKVQELEEVWNWAGQEANRIAREEVGAEGWDDVFTLAESETGIENVITGLRRKLWESEGEESEDEDGDLGMKEDGEDANKQNGTDKMDVDKKEESTKEERNLDGFDHATRLMMTREFDDTKPPLPLETILRLQLTGQFSVRR